MPPTITGLQLPLQPLRPPRSSSMPQIAFAEQPASTTQSPGSNQSHPPLEQEFLPETIQEVSEPSTRSYYKTMNQKAAKSNRQGKKKGRFAGRLELPDPVPTPKPARPQATAKPLIVGDPIPEFHKHVNASFGNLMHGLRGFSGEIIVRAELGRIILKKIPAKFISSEDSLRTYPPEELMDLMRPRPERPNSSSLAFFSNVMTELPLEINYLREMKNSAGQLMWESSVKDRCIIYEISCHDEGLAGWNPFSIEIDGKTFESRVKTRRDFGAINVHGTRRHWDFRIAAFGSSNSERNDKRYGEFAKAIQSSLYIP